MMVDSHAHLYFDNFDDDLNDVLRRAKNSGVNRILNIGIDLETSQKSIDLANSYDEIYASVGIHPNEADNLPDDYIDNLIQYLEHPKVVAIGEIGLDYYRDYTPKEKQLIVFQRQLDLALEKNYPIIVHTRNAWPDMIDVFNQEKYQNKLRGVVHCFSGDVSVARLMLDLGFFISFTGVITFKNSGAVDVLKKIPLERLLLETDCPFMAPVPFRGKRCEPMHVTLIGEKIAEIHNVSIEKVAAQTTKNIHTLFGIPI